MHTGNISDHFSWYEVEYSETAERERINNSVPKELEGVVIRTAFFMEKVRALLGAPIRINSWYRCPELQKLPAFINPTSQHPKGEAVDFISLGFNSCAAIAKKIIEYRYLIPYDQLILEHTWVHISFCSSDPSSKPRGQVLSLLKNKQYHEGLTDLDGNPI
jgi:hypothetical protein